MIVRGPNGTRRIIAGPTVTHGHMQRADGTTLTDADLDRVLDQAARSEGFNTPIQLQRAPSTKLRTVRTTQPRHTHCKRGHAMEGDNIVEAFVGIRVRRTCRECRKMRERAHRKTDRVLIPGPHGRPVAAFCNRGHAMEGANLHVNADGVRKCRACRRIQESRRRELARAA